MSVLWMVWIPVLGSAIFGGLGVLILWQSRQAQSQLSQAAQGLTTTSDGPLDGLRQWVAHTGAGRWMRQRLDQAGVSLHEADALGMALIGTIVAFYVAQRILALQPFGAFVVAVSSNVVGIRSFLGAQRQRHNRRFVEQLPEVSWVFANALRAGMSVQQALALVAREVPKPARQFFQRLVDEIELARPVEEVLAGSVRLMPSQEYGLMVTITVIQYRAGGDLAGAMEELSHTLMERKSVNEEVQSATAGARTTALILPFMPLLCAGVLNVAIPGALNVLFTGWGLLLLAGFMFFQWMAFVAIRKMTDIKV